MKSIIGAATLTLLVSSNGLGQTLQIPEQIGRLGSKARETVNITLDGSLLRLASQFLSSTDTDQAKIRKIISRLNAIQVRTFEFDNDAQYSDADIAPLRSQLRAPAWSRILESRSNGDHVEVFVRQEQDKIGGLVLLAAERKELAIISIDGSIDLSELASLDGQFGIPSGIIPRPAPSK
jgi:hypothetical protein